MDGYYNNNPSFPDKYTSLYPTEDQPTNKKKKSKKKDKSKQQHKGTGNIDDFLQ